jgi:rhodanese-related sulfurtransferase/thioredoxin-related protein
MNWPKNPKRIVNGLVNAILIIAIATFVFTFGRRYVAEHAFSNASISPDGQTFAIEGIDFSKSDQTLLLVLDRNCGFCKQETPFYRKLVEKSQATGVRVIGVFQHDLKDAKQYLSDEGINVTETTRIRFPSFQIDATPTVILLNRNGNLIGRWIGSLSDPIRDYVVSIMGVNETLIRLANSPYLRLGNRMPPPLITAADLRTKLKSENTTTILDIDDRVLFGQRHLSGAVNIPADEVYARAQNELSPSRLIVLYSRGSDPRRVSNSQFVLQEQGFENIAWLKLTLEESRSSGIDITDERDLRNRAASPTPIEK